MKSRIYLSFAFLYFSISLTPSPLASMPATPGAIKPILTLKKDPQDAATKLLRLKRKKVTDFNDPTFLTECESMVQTFKSLGTAGGLASAQIGGTWDIIVISPDRKTENAYVFVNPTLEVAPNTPRIATREGCFSCPNTIAERDCPTEAVFTAFTPEGRKVSATITNPYLLMVLNHEIRHNQGLLIVDGAASYQEHNTEGYNKVLQSIRQEHNKIGGCGEPAFAVLRNLLGEALPESGKITKPLKDD